MTAQPRLNTLWYERERQDLLRAYEMIHGKVSGRIIPHNRPLPNLSDVWRCAQLAKAESSIWEEAQRAALLTVEQFEGRGSYLGDIMSVFVEWYRLKNGLYDLDNGAFCRIVPTLREWARPDFRGSALARLRYYIQSFPGIAAIDDILDQENNEDNRK